jgi:hypothetical protein
LLVGIIDRLELPLMRAALLVLASLRSAVLSLWHALARSRIACVVLVRSDRRCDPGRIRRGFDQAAGVTSWLRAWLDSAVVWQRAVRGHALRQLAPLAYTAVLAACGSPVIAPKILPPNTVQACDRAIACKVFLLEQKPECVNCIEKLAEQHADALKQDLPPLDTVACDVIAKYAHDTLVSECVVRRSFGP